MNQRKELHYSIDNQCLIAGKVAPVRWMASAYSLTLEPLSRRYGTYFHSSVYHWCLDSWHNEN